VSVENVALVPKFTPPIQRKKMDKYGHMCDGVKTIIGQQSNPLLQIHHMFGLLTNFIRNYYSSLNK